MGCHERGIHLGGAQGGPGIVALWPNAHLTSVSSPEWAELGMKLPVWETTGDPEAKGRKSPAGAHSGRPWQLFWAQEAAAAGVLLGLMALSSVRCKQLHS